MTQLFYDSQARLINVFDNDVCVAQWKKEVFKAVAVVNNQGSEFIVVLLGKASGERFLNNNHLQQSEDMRNNNIFHLSLKYHSQEEAMAQFKYLTEDPKGPMIRQTQQALEELARVSQ